MVPLWAIGHRIPLTPSLLITIGQLFTPNAVFPLPLQQVMAPFQPSGPMWCRGVAAEPS